MAAVIRVKRRVDEDPLEAFVLNSKRRKEETPADRAEVSTILKFAGTVQNQSESLSQATRLTKEEARAIVSSGRREPPEDVRQRKRDEQRQNAQNERFRIVNCSRTVADAEGAEAATGDTAKQITILDIEKQSIAGDETRLGSGREVAAGGGAAQSAETTHQRTVQEAAAGPSPAENYVYDLYVPDVGQPELEWSEQFLANMLRFVPLEEEINLIFSYTYF